MQISDRDWALLEELLVWWKRETRGRRPRRRGGRADDGSGNIRHAFPISDGNPASGYVRCRLDDPTSGDLIDVYPHIHYETALNGCWPWLQAGRAIPVYSLDDGDGNGERWRTCVVFCKKKPC